VLKHDKMLVLIGAKKLSGVFTYRFLSVLMSIIYDEVMSLSDTPFVIEEYWCYGLHGSLLNDSGVLCY
jgi:hypothetical protein